MDRFKNLFHKKKVDTHFKKSGPGQRLTDTDNNAAQVPLDRDAAALAALNRLNANKQPSISAGQKKIQMMAQREIEEERRKCAMEKALENLALEPKREPDIREFEHSNAIAEVYYTCELLGDVCMKKSQLFVAIEEFLLDKLNNEVNDQLSLAILLLYSVNTSAVINIAVETICKYLQNIIANPQEQKYKRIRASNKAFQERVISAKGGLHVLKAIGFYEEQHSAADGQVSEIVYVMTVDVAENTEHLVTAIDALMNGRSVSIKVARNPSFVQLKENERLDVPKVSSEFFNLTADEVKKEQQLKTDEVNRMLTLRTKEMREKDEKLRQYKYKYSLLKIRLPNRYVLEGTFGSYEKISDVREFINPYLEENVQGTVWSLKDPMCGSRVLNENGTIGELGLTPAAILHFVTE